MYHIEFKFGLDNKELVTIPLKHVKKTDFIKYSKAVIIIDFESVFKRITLKYNYWQDNYTLDIEYIDRIKLEAYYKKSFNKKHLKDCLQLIKKER